jgi:tetratricopeptide (TPR) repeat protein
MNEEKVRTRHLKYFSQLAEQAEPALRGPEQVIWRTRLYDERHNLRAALEWADKTDIEAGLFTTSRLYCFWESFDMQEGARWLAEFIHNPESKAFPLARAKALLVYGRILGWMNQYMQVRTVAEECLDLFRACGDRQGEIDGLLLLGYVRWALDSMQDVELHKQALALAESLDDLWRQASALYQLGWNYNGDQQLAYWEKAIRLMRRSGDWRSLAGMLNIFGTYAMLDGKLELAQERLDESARFNDQLKDKGIAADLLDARARMAMLEGDYSQARTLLQEVLDIIEELGARMNLLWCRSQFGYLALHEGNIGEARIIFVETAQNFQKDRVVIGTVFNLEGMAGLYIAVGKPECSARLIGSADAARQKIGSQRPLVEQVDVDKIIALCLANMGEAAFSDAYDEGQKMTLEEAVTYALGES